MRALCLVALLTVSACVAHETRARTPVSTRPLAPPEDLDRDGVIARADRCPNAAEDRDGVADDDGCPEVDQDCDHVADQQDRCPLRAEDRDEFEDSDGCPDEDNDQDRIVDRCDRCPNAPEVYNGVEDTDGCTDHGYVLLESGVIRILDHPNFERGSEAILPRYRPLLDAIAQTLISNPQILLVTVQGHASQDERGAQRLGQRRAEAVRAYLLQHGVDGARLAARSYGATRPIDAAPTAQARERNRRVDFNIERTIDGPNVARPIVRPTPSPPVECPPEPVVVLVPGGCPLP